MPLCLQCGPLLEPIVEEPKNEEIQVKKDDFDSEPEVDSVDMQYSSEETEKVEPPDAMTQSGTNTQVLSARPAQTGQFVKGSQPIIKSRRDQKYFQDH